MNRTERLLLLPLVKQVRKAHPNAWWELKRQVWDRGYQAYYPAQDEFHRLAEGAIARLPAQSLATLVNAFRKTDAEPPASEGAIRSHYAGVIVEVIVRRAAIAAYRTSEW